MIIWITPTHSVRPCFLCFSCFFSPHLSNVLVLWLLTVSVSLPRNRSVRCVLGASVHVCLRAWTWHILSWCSSHSKLVLTIKWNMHAQLFSHSPNSGPLQTRLKKSFARYARSSTVNARVRQFWNKLAYSNNLGWEIRSNRDIPWTKDSTLLSLEANYSAFYLFCIKYLQTQSDSPSTGKGQDGGVMWWSDKHGSRCVFAL